jgi:hypothetical protein
VLSDVVSSRLRTPRTVAWSSGWCADGQERKKENHGEVHVGSSALWRAEGCTVKELVAIALRRIWDLTHERPGVVERVDADLVSCSYSRSSRRPRDEEDLPP